MAVRDRAQLLPHGDRRPADRPRRCRTTRRRWRDSSEEVHRREDLRELVAGIGRLPEDQRSALLLAELDDLDHRAIATIVGCEVSKVKALIYQARSALIADRDAREHTL